MLLAGRKSAPVPKAAKIASVCHSQAGGSGVHTNPQLCMVDLLSRQPIGSSSPHHFSSSSNCWFSSSTFTKSEYIHPLSQIVLEHLQTHHSSWIEHVGLDKGLNLNKDGTFVLRFPSVNKDESASTDDRDDDVKSEDGNASISGSIW